MKLAYLRDQSLSICVATGLWVGRGLGRNDRFCSVFPGEGREVVTGAGFWDDEDESAVP